MGTVVAKASQMVVSPEESFCSLKMPGKGQSAPITIEEDWGGPVWVFLNVCTLPDN